MGKPWGNEYLGKEAVESLEGLVYLKKVAREVAYIYLCKVAVGKP